MTSIFPYLPPPKTSRRRIGAAPTWNTEAKRRYLERKAGEREQIVYSDVGEECKRAGL